MKREFLARMAAFVAPVVIVVVVGGSDAYANCGRSDNSCGTTVPAPVHPTPAPSPSPCGGGGCQPTVPVPGTPGNNGLNGLNGQPGNNGLNGQPGTNGNNGLNGQPGTNGRDGRDGRDSAPSNSSAAANSDANSSSNSDSAATAAAKQILDNANSQGQSLSSEQLSNQLQIQGFSPEVSNRVVNKMSNSGNSSNANTNTTTSQGGEGGKADANSNSSVKQSGNSQNQVNVDNSQKTGSVLFFQPPGQVTPATATFGTGFQFIVNGPDGAQIAITCTRALATPNTGISFAGGGFGVSLQHQRVVVHGDPTNHCQAVGELTRDAGREMVNILRNRVNVQPVVAPAPATATPTVIINNGMGQTQQQFNPTRPNPAVQLKN